MRFGVLGALECWHGGVPIPLGGPRQRTVLATLLVHANQLVGTDHLTDSVWSAAPASPRTNLRTYLTGLRRCFRDAGADPSVLESHSGGTYRLRVCPSDVDVHAFTGLADAGDRALERGDVDRAESLFAQSLRRWRGVPLDGAEVGAPLHAEFTRLQQRRLSVVEGHARAAIQGGRPDRAIADLRAEVTQHPLRETLWTQLITALHEAGHAAEALRGYAEVRRILAEELGVEPGTELRQIYHRMLRTGASRSTHRSPLPRRVPAADIVDRDELGHPPGESAFHAARGERPPAEFVSSSGVWDVLEQMFARVRHESLSFDHSAYTRDGELPERIVVRGPRCPRAVVDRVAAVRQITSTGGLSADEAIGCMQTSRCGSACTVPTVPFKLLVLDRRVAIVPANLRLLTDRLLIVWDRSVVERLVASHTALRESGHPVPASAEGPPSYLVPVLHQLLRGATDRAAAAELGISPRSYCRRVGDLLALLGVSSRFQAGVEAARRGWI